MARGANFLLQIAANPVDHLKFVLIFGEFESGNFRLGVGDHHRVVGSDGRQESILRGAFKQHGRQLLEVCVHRAFPLQRDFSRLAIGAFD